MCRHLFYFILILCFCSPYSFARVQRAWDYEKVWCWSWYWSSWFAWHCCQTKRGVFFFSLSLSIEFPQNGIRFRQRFFGCAYVLVLCLILLIIFRCTLLQKYTGVMQERNFWMLLKIWSWIRWLWEAGVSAQSKGAYFLVP